MTPATIIRNATADGVELRVSGGSLKASGDREALTRWLPIIRENKPEILSALQGAANDDSAQPAPPHADRGTDQDPRKDAERIAKVVATLEVDPALRYAVDTHADVDLEEVILSVAVRGKGTCEVRIPKSRYDGFALLELIEKHTTRETLQ
jgi:hypothetical protein